MATHTRTLRRLGPIVLVVILGLLVIAALVAWQRTKRLQHVELVETLRAQVVQLDSARQILNRGRIPYDWPAAAYVSDGALNRVLDTFQGSKFKSAKLPGAWFEIESLDADSRIGATHVAVTIRAGSNKSSSLSLRLKGSALLVLKGIETSADPGISAATFRISMLNVAPSLSISSLTAEGSSFANRIISAHIVEAIAESLDVPLPLRVAAKLDFDVNEDDRIKTGETEFDLHLRMPEAKIGHKLELTTPLAAANGLWFFVNDGPALILPSSSALSGNTDALKQTIKRLEGDIKPKLDAVLSPESDVALWLSNAFVAQPLMAFGELKPTERRVSATVDGIKGDLVHETVSVLAHDNAGLIISLQSADGHLQVESVRTRWNVQDGLHATVLVSAHATAHVKSVLNTIVGGGISTDFTLNGDARQPLDIALGIRPIKDKKETALMLGPVFTCDNVKVVVETAGALKLGVELYVPLIDDPGKGVILFDTIPRYRKRAIASNEAITFVGDQPWVRSSWNEIRTSTDQVGYLVQANLNVASDSELPPGAVVEPMDNSAFQVAWEKATAPKCPPKPSSKVLFAGQDFGPNNELVKVLVALYTSVEKSAHIVKVSSERLLRAHLHPDEIPQISKEIAEDITKVGAKAYDDFEDSTKIALGQAEAELKRAKEKVNKEVPIIPKVVHAPRDIGRSIKDEIKKW